MIDFQPYVDTATQVPLGHYALSCATGATTGMGANAPIFAFRWADAGNTTTPANLDPPRLCLILNIDIGAVITTAFGTAQSVDAEVIVARGWTASDTGGTAITAPSRMRSVMEPSLVTDIRVATTSALSAGTRTLDSNGIANCTIYTQNTAGSGDMQQSVYAAEAAGVHPLTLTKNEGLIVRVPTAQGASGVVKYYLAIQWCEVPALPVV